MEELKRACTHCGGVFTCDEKDYNALEFFCDDCFEELLLEMCGREPAERTRNETDE